jgi:putative nucleotidyltransferase with HDIG domain
MLFAAVLFGPLAAMVVASASMLGDFTRPYLRWGIYTSSRAITAALVGTVAIATSDAIESRSVAIAVSTIVAAVVAQTLDGVFAAMTVYLRRRGGVVETARLLLPVAAAALPLYAPLVALLAIGYDQLSPWATILFFVPALAAQRLYTLYQEQRHLTEDLTEANAQLERANVSFAAALVATLDARDQYTAGHSAAVAIYSRDIARRMGLDESEQQMAHLAGLVHDIGKIGLPPGLLEKAGPLTLDERRVMQEHSEIGERILVNVDTYSEIAHIVRHHHERVDGNGYPDGLTELETPLLARIIAVADAYNAMTSDRPYREAMPSRVARMRLAQAVGTQFDTSVVAAFEAILATADEPYRLGQSVDFNSGISVRDHDQPVQNVPAAVVA